MSKTVGIFCAGQWGDCGTISSVLKYRNELWDADHKIIWWISKENADLLAHSDIEVREFPRGFGYPDMVIEENRKLVEQGKDPIWQDWACLVDENNMLDIEKAKDYPSLQGIDIGYFPAPHQVHHTKRVGLNYPVVSKKVFKIPDEYKWHPVLKFSENERINAQEFLDQMWVGKNVFVESFAGSSQSILSAEMNERTMWICREYWPKCNFIFGSHKFLRQQEQFPDKFFEKEGVYSCANFTPRQTALISGKCDLFLSVSSGLSVAASCWENINTAPPMLQFCGSEVCGTKELYAGYFNMVTADLKRFEDVRDEYHVKLIEILNQYK